MRVQQLLPIKNIDRLIKLGDAVRILDEIFYNELDRKTVVAWCEEGLLDHEQIGKGNNYYIYQSSLISFIEKYQSKNQQLAA